ncbi:hypothetical protein [Quatrionicoccus australiensis]|uniref:hypothetical protein n=1 Tax=Quatrionicoccus australiensis TaxID=138118 RepID=UPI001CF8A787|nr:hypothetical protein [Quatrionicoccus australiensis]UCV15756.1 hypothetical protein KI612_03340 [Quatrionicoccus australiensis]
MSDQKKTAPVKTAPAAKSTAAPKPPKKLVPRTAPKPAPEVVVAAAAEPVVVPEVVTPAPAEVPATAAAVKAKPARKPSRVDETVSKHQKVLADALVKAQAIKYDKPAVVKAEPPKAGKAAKAEKPVRQKKPKLVRDSYAMPEDEYAQIGALKKRLAGLGRETKKSELLRGGIALLAALNDAELTAVMGRVERIKTGRPAK